MENPLAAMAISLISNSNKFEKINCVAWKLYHNGREKWFRPGKLGLFCQLKSLPDCFHDSAVYIKNCPEISKKQILKSEIKEILIQIVQ